MPKWGKNILENLTTGMYQDSKVSYREYVQNACDQIRVAIEENIISADQAQVTIFVGERNKRGEVHCFAPETSKLSFPERTNLFSSTTFFRFPGHQAG